jgi:tRNA-modifying protein YgfZ
MTATSTFAQDYETLTSGCGLVDRSERGKLALTGAGAKEFLNGQLTNDVTSLTPGNGLYAAFLTRAMSCCWIPSAAPSRTCST